MSSFKSSKNTQKKECGPDRSVSDKRPINSLLNVPRCLFCCVSLLPVFVVRASLTFHLKCVHFIFCSVWVAESPPLGK